MIRKADCPHCEGFGTHQRIVLGRRVNYECDTCHGDGFIPVEVEDDDPDLINDAMVDVLYKRGLFV